ncbi:3f698dab-9b24-4c7e-832b-f5b6151cae59 [Sclerotinia trifoliorum]|uniref:3f698dab-9b24-4c7e-832b-f5b6151cae59 n=1 Tax=Sclerotinia trifoliorum TaxID=28548 RepID=A0A8H2VSV9_9HELO|nr:3f698dab-9b24-4c7e-832b-f5b6151cae59 [Sclerotinia trifoliorum]
MNLVAQWTIWGTGELVRLSNLLRMPGNIRASQASRETFESCCRRLYLMNFCLYRLDVFMTLPTSLRFMLYFSQGLHPSLLLFGLEAVSFKHQRKNPSTCLVPAKIFELRWHNVFKSRTASWCIATNHPIVCELLSSKRCPPSVNS